MRASIPLSRRRATRFRAVSDQFHRDRWPRSIVSSGALVRRVISHVSVSQMTTSLTSGRGRYCSCPEAIVRFRQRRVLICCLLL